MDLVSVYLRVFFGAKPFASDELDSLALRMGLLDQLSADPGERYFIINGKSVTAANVGNRIVFGSRYYGSLTGDQRLAVGAHEFGHSLFHRKERLMIALSSVSSSLLTAAAGFLATRSLLASELFFLCSFFLVIGVLSSREARNGLKDEVQCDGLAVSFVGPEPMIASIRLAETMARPGFLQWPGKGISSTVEERAAAIRRAQEAANQGWLRRGSTRPPDGTSHGW